MSLKSVKLRNTLYEKKTYYTVSVSVEGSQNSINTKKHIVQKEDIVYCVSEC